MTFPVTRRKALSLLGAGTLMPFAPRLFAEMQRDFRIRTITAGAPMGNINDLGALKRAADFLLSSRKKISGLDYEVQTLRLSTQPLFDYLSDWQSASSLTDVRALDAFASEQGMMLSLGPVNHAGQNSDEFIEWVVRLIAGTTNTSCSLIVAAADRDEDRQAYQTAAKIMQGIARTTKGGEGNFRFVATAYCPPGTPFFPASYFDKESFSIGLESPDLLQAAFSATKGGASPEKQLKQNLESACAPIQKQAEKIAQSSGRSYSGIDTSPAPNLDVSIGRAIETLSGVPFGSPSTLAACAAITDVLKSLDVKSCGYSGLMLPILEDTTLARRAGEGRFSVSDLLLYSSVCGTGLDVVPLAGDIAVEHLAGLIHDVAALAEKYSKPLSARLFPVPGKKAGELVSFDNPYLTSAIVMDVD